jgi:hypothetical protein
MFIYRVLGFRVDQSIFLQKSLPVESSAPPHLIHGRGWRVDSLLLDDKSIAELAPELERHLDPGHHRSSDDPSDHLVPSSSRGLTPRGRD